MDTDADPKKHYAYFKKRVTFFYTNFNKSFREVICKFWIIDFSKFILPTYNCQCIPCSHQQFENFKTVRRSFFIFELLERDFANNLSPGNAFCTIFNVNFISSFQITQ